MTKIKTVYVVGFYGVSNYGDDLFCEAINLSSDRLFPGEKVRIVSPVDLSGRGRPKLPRWLTRYFGSSGVAGILSRLVTGLYIAVRGDLIVMGGGSVLSDVHGVRRLQQLVARLTGVRFAALGVSLGPFTDDVSRNRVAAFANTFERLVVRDRESVEQAGDMGLTEKCVLGGDLASLYPRAGQHRATLSDGRKRIMVIPCRYEGFRPAELARGVASALEENSLSSDDVGISVLSVNNHDAYGDDALAAELVTELKALGHRPTGLNYEDLGVKETWDLIAVQDAVISGRLHGGITAYLASVPYTLIEYHTKCKDFNDDVGLPPERRIAPQFVAEDVSVALTDLLRGPQLGTQVRPADYVAEAQRAYLQKDG